MAAETRSQGSRGNTGTQTEFGMVIRALRNDPQSDKELMAIVQQIGELRFNKKKIEELKGESQRNWISFNHSVAQAQHSFTELMKLLEQAVKEERDADLERIAAEIDDLASRRQADELQAAREQERLEAREETEKAHDEAFFLLEITDIEQELGERKDKHLQRMTERETRRKLQLARDVVLLSLTILCVLVSSALIVVGAINQEPLIVGSSSVSAAIAITGFIKMFFFGWGLGIPDEDLDDSLSHGTS
jgi:hypothetical protein